MIFKICGKSYKKKKCGKKNILAKTRRKVGHFDLSGPINSRAKTYKDEKRRYN
jgi:hypothetical protein